MSTAFTKDQVQAALQLAVAVGDTIRKLGSVPAGHLYAQLMGKMDMAGFQALMSMLEEAGLITYDEHHLISWVGPRGNGDVR